MDKGHLAPLTIEKIQQFLESPLPGAVAQKKMAPQSRTGELDRWHVPADCRKAAVLLLLYPHVNNGRPPELHLALIRRTEYDGVHSGQIALPGGQREAGESLQETALRETMEEIGVPPCQVQVIGCLSPLYTPPSNFCITPFVAISTRRPDFQLDDKEVAALLEVPVHQLLNPAIHRKELWQFQNYGQRVVPFFDVSGQKVWGATAMILSEFLTLLSDSFFNTD